MTQTEEKPMLVVQPPQSSAVAVVVNQSAGRRPHRWLGSLTILLSLILSVSYLLLFYLYPWRDLASSEMPGWIIRIAANVPDYITGFDKKPIIFLGSSLIMAPSSALKDVREGPIDAEGKKSGIVQSTYYEAELKKLTGQNLPIRNLAVPGGMISDQKLILKEMIKHGKAPKFLVITLAPRDFTCNGVAETPINTPTQRVFTFYTQNRNLLPQELTAEAFTNCWQGHQTFAQLVSHHYSRYIKDKFCAYTGRSANLWAATKKMERDGQKGQKEVTDGKDSGADAPAKPYDTLTVAERAQRLSHDLDLYKTRYLPPNTRGFALQSAALDDLLAEAKQARINVLMVQMPVTKANWAILQDSQKNAYNDVVEKVATKYGIELVNFNSGPRAVFSNADFGDSVHMNKFGALHFIPLFSKAMVDSNAFKAAFPTR